MSVATIRKRYIRSVDKNKTFVYKSKRVDLLSGIDFLDGLIKSGKETIHTVYTHKGWTYDNATLCYKRVRLKGKDNLLKECRDRLTTSFYYNLIKACRYVHHSGIRTADTRSKGEIVRDDLNLTRYTVRHGALPHQVKLIIDQFKSVTYHIDERTDSLEIHFNR